MTVYLQLIAAIHCSRWFLTPGFLRVGTFPLLICFSFTLLSPVIGSPLGAQFKVPVVTGQ